MIPCFAVVGHPNKGKSSIVSTLARDDRVAISMQSGTTSVSEYFDIKMGDEHYQLVDTPGFQRARKVLAWLNQSNPSADQRCERIQQFLSDPSCNAIYKDEIELLKPIMAGAAILYVVDGSRPYSAEYEAEMEILRWTGQPSMALINPIVNDDHVQSWKLALGQYFSVVRVFNAVKAQRQQHIDLLRAFGAIHQPWSRAIELLINAFAGDVAKQTYQSCFIAAKMLEELTEYQVGQKVPVKAQAQSLKHILEQQYYQWMRQRELAAHDDLQRLYHHHHIARDKQELILPDDLFDTEKWYGWGLDRKQLASVAGLAGAAAGGALDLAVAGHSFMLGALGGGAIGSSAAWLGADKLASAKVKGLPLGGYEARFGPMRNKNFPYVVLGRYLFSYQLLYNRNHAQRDRLCSGEMSVSQLLEKLSLSDKKTLSVALDRLSRQKSVPDLTDALMPLFEFISHDGAAN